MALLFEEYYKGSDKKEFIESVIAISEDLGIVPDWLMAVMYIESGLNSTIENSKGYVGLIQFGESARKDLKVTKQQLKTMGAVKQLEYVYKYYKGYARRGLINEFTDLSLVTLYPNAGGTVGGTLKKPKDWIFPKEVQRDNPGIWTDKKAGTNKGEPVLSIASYEAWVKSKIPKNKRDKIITKESNVSKKEVQNIEYEEIQDQKGYVLYIHNYSDITTLKDLIKFKDWYIPGKKELPKDTDLLNFEDNEQRIKKSFTKRNLSQIKGSIQDNLTVGTELKIPSSWITDRFKTFDGSQNVFPNSDLETFISKSLLQATNNPRFDKKFIDTSTGTTNTVTKIVPKPKVLVWCKAANLKVNQRNKPKFQSDGQIFDLSPFIQNLQTSVNSNVGTFSFTLPPLICEYDDFGWKISEENVKFFNDNDEFNFIAKTSINNTSETRNKWLFHNLISDNDVVWITFDNLDTEVYNFTVDKTRIAGNYYDMIGLIDTNNYNYQSMASIGISIRGRDMMKLLLEDSSYYLSFGDKKAERDSAVEGIFKNDNPENWGRPFRQSRLKTDGEIFNLSIASARTVGEMLSFIMSSLASIEIAPDDLFVSYQNQADRNQGFGISKYNFFDNISKENKVYKAAGIWQIIKLQIDNYAVNDRYVVDNKLAVFSGSLINGMKMFVDDVFIELFGDTYVDQYFYMVRRPPFNFKCVTDYISKITDATEDNGQTIIDDKVVGEDLQWYDRDVYCWYRINLPIISNLGGGSTLPYRMFPTLFFREYAEIYGVKGLDVHSNYSPLNKLPQLNDDKVNNIWDNQTFEDLSYLVEINSYLPFTRMGTITIKGGENRIKRGTWIRYAPTKEIFYVDTVVQNYSVNTRSVDRTTTLTVSRGMVEYNKSGQYVLPLYFNIIRGLRNKEEKEQEKLNKEQVTLQKLNVYFDFNKEVTIDVFANDLSDKDVQELNDRKELYELGEQSLNDLVTKIKENPTSKIKIIGHTDENGNSDFNLHLSKKRAETIKSDIIKRWKIRYKEPLDESRITTEGKGSAQILASNKGFSDEETKKIDSLNRRVEAEFTITFKEDNNKPPQANKKNDYSEIKVNQSIFNFFKARRQFVDFDENIDSLINDTYDFVKPTDLEILDVIKKENEKQLEENSQSPKTTNTTVTKTESVLTFLDKYNKTTPNKPVEGKYEKLLLDENARLQFVDKLQSK